MTDVFYKLPTVLILGALVLILAFLRKQHETETFRLWLSAWILIFFRFSLQLVYSLLGLSSPFYLALDMGILQISGVLFMASVSKVAEIPGRRRALIAGMSVPIAIYALLAAYQIDLRLVYAACLTGVAITSMVHAIRTLPTRWIIAFSATVTFLWVSSVAAVFQNHLEVGFFSVMTGTYAVAAILFVRRYRRLTPGVVATSLGFLFWALVAPITYWLWRLPMGLPIISNELANSPKFILAIGLSNVPKFIVAIGMIVTLLEDERITAEIARQRERLSNNQMRRFADVTSRLLSGADVPAFCPEITAMIADASNYERAAILLTGDQHHLYLAGQSGLSEAEVQAVKAGLAGSTLDSLQTLCVAENRFGPNSYRTRTEKMEGMGAVLTHRDFRPNPNWQAGDEILVPLRSSRGTFVGMISLDDPKHLERVTADDMLPIEILACDMAVAIENATLQMQLFQSEKLAGMGQLVAGVAHELNNPLTAVLGYTEMLGDRSSDPTILHDLGVMRREALRMKRIIENLQRFSRQQKVERGVVKLASLVDDVIKMKSYELLGQNIEIIKNIDPALPNVVANEALINQVFLNVLTNAIEAVQGANTKRITVEARAQGKQVLLQVSDSGPGFKDLNRVFDPFYTTKAPGKGTGLGLSICYGIIKDHGGDISANNMHPIGACVSIQLPFGASKISSAEAVVGR